jgi:hypothetical protein
MEGRIVTLWVADSFVPPSWQYFIEAYATNHRGKGWQCVGVGVFNHDDVVSMRVADAVVVWRSDL